MDLNQHEFNSYIDTVIILNKIFSSNKELCRSIWLSNTLLYPVHIIWQVERLVVRKGYLTHGACWQAWTQSGWSEWIMINTSSPPHWSLFNWAADQRLEKNKKVSCSIWIWPAWPPPATNWKNSIIIMRSWSIKTRHGVLFLSNTLDRVKRVACFFDVVYIVCRLDCFRKVPALYKGTGFQWNLLNLC